MSMVGVYIYSNSLYTHTTLITYVYIQYIIKALSYAISFVDLSSFVQQRLDHFR